MKEIVTTEKMLKQMFQRLNKAYFEGKLKDVRVRFADLTNDEADGVWDADGIDIDRAMQYVGVSLVEVVLLHEMIHAQMPQYGHSMRFQARIVDLFDKGAYDGLL